MLSLPNSVLIIWKFQARRAENTVRGAAYGDTKTALHATHNNAERRREISPPKELSCGGAGLAPGFGAGGRQGAQPPRPTDGGHNASDELR